MPRRSWPWDADLSRTSSASARLYRQAWQLVCIRTHASRAWAWSPNFRCQEVEVYEVCLVLRPSDSRELTCARNSRYTFIRMDCYSSKGMCEYCGVEQTIRRADCSDSLAVQNLQCVFETWWCAQSCSCFAHLFITSVANFIEYLETLQC